MSHVVALIEALASASDRSPHTVGRWLSGDGALYRRLTDDPPHDITTRRAQRIIQAASDRWPDGHPWPPGIARPEPTPGSPAAAGLRDASPAAVLAAVRECLARESALLDDPDFDLNAVQAAQAEMARAALTLGPDGRIASPRALCEAVKVPRHAYDGVVRRLAAGLPPPRRGAARTVWMCLRQAGDVRAAGSAA